MSFLLQNQLTEALRVEEDEEPEQRKTRSQPQLIPLFHLFPSRGWQLACVCLLVISCCMQVIALQQEMKICRR